MSDRRALIRRINKEALALWEKTAPERKVLELFRLFYKEHKFSRVEAMKLARQFHKERGGVTKEKKWGIF